MTKTTISCSIPVDDEAVTEFLHKYLEDCAASPLLALLDAAPGGDAQAALST